MIKCLFCCNPFQPPVHSFVYCLPPFFFMQDVMSVLQLSSETVMVVVVVVVGVSVRVQDGHSSPPHTHSPVITAALQILHICIALHCLASLLPSPHHLCLPPSHVSTPPSGSSKYFPWLLFEASMGHGTSCTNHAGLPWGGRSERTGVSQTHGNPIRTVFIQGCFSCQDSHHQSAAGPKQRV